MKEPKFKVGELVIWDNYFCEVVRVFKDIHDTLLSPFVYSVDRDDANWLVDENELTKPK